MAYKIPKTKEEARSEAITYQQEFSKKRMDYKKLIEAEHHFQKTGKKFGLIKEFKENGII
jgi:hypothetical protein